MILRSWNSHRHFSATFFMLRIPNIDDNSMDINMFSELVSTKSFVSFGAKYYKLDVSQLWFCISGRVYARMIWGQWGRWVWNGHDGESDVARQGHLTSYIAVNWFAWRGRGGETHSTVILLYIALHLSVCRHSCIMSISRDANYVC